MFKLLSFIKSKGRSRRDEFAVPSTSTLIRQEAKVGSRLFGIVPPDRRREFFCLDRNTWIWYEEWTDDQGKRQAVHTRYQLRGDIVLKYQGDNQPEMVFGEELANLNEAVRSYYYRVAKEVYHRPVRA